MMQYLLLVSVLHFADTNQQRALNVETLQIKTNNCEMVEQNTREYYKSERYSRIINLKCMRVN